MVWLLCFHLWWRWLLERWLDKMKMLKKYIVFIVVLIILGLTFIYDKGLGLKAVDTIKFSFKEMMMVLPPIFILLGLLDVWVPKDTMVKFMGEDSGIVGILLSFFLGSAAAGPLYGAFPVAAIFMKKGVKFTNILIFLGAWSTTKLPMLLFEVASMGIKFTVTRFITNIFGILIIAYTVNRSLKKQDLQEMYAQAEFQN